MKATMHNGRIAGALHNDREFAKSGNFHDDGHIDFSKTAENISWQLYPDMSFAENERKYYEEHFSKALAEVNEAYIRNRHPERCKTMDDWLSSTRTCPEESILQIGNIAEHGSKEELNACVEDFITWFKAETKGHCQILDMSLHVDEATPHFQMRRVWQYDDKGTLKIGQDKALKALGYELPNPDAPTSRYNNRKKSFDEKARQKWYDICEEHGFEIDREPIKGRTHKQTYEYIEEQLEAHCDELTLDIATLEEKRDTLKAENKALSEQREKLVETVSSLKADVSALEEQKKGVEAYIDKVRGAIQGMLWEFVQRPDIKPKWEEFVKWYKAQMAKRAEERQNRPSALDDWQSAIAKEKQSAPILPKTTSREKSIKRPER